MDKKTALLILEKIKELNYNQFNIDQLLSSGDYVDMECEDCGGTCSGYVEVCELVSIYDIKRDQYNPLNLLEEYILDHFCIKDLYTEDTV